MKLTIEGLEPGNGVWDFCRAFAALTSVLTAVRMLDDEIKELDYEIRFSVIPGPQLNLVQVCGNAYTIKVNVVLCDAKRPLSQVLLMVGSPDCFVNETSFCTTGSSPRVINGRELLEVLTKNLPVSTSK